MATGIQHTELSEILIINKSKLSYYILYSILTFLFVFSDIWFMEYVQLMNYFIFSIFCIRLIRKL